MTMTKTDTSPPAGATASGPLHVLTDPTIVPVPPLALVTVLVISTPGWVRFATILTVLAWIALAIVWAVAVVSYVRTRRRTGGRAHPLVPLLVFPGFLAIVLVLAAASLPLRARFALSRDELDSSAHAVLVVGAPVPDTKIGSFPIESVETDGHTVWFVTEGLGTDDRWGFVYGPEGPPDQPDQAGIEVVALDGGWYAFHEGTARFPFL
jgi:hypothetical protein